MDSFELNKVAGAVLGTLLFALGTGFLAEIIYHPKPAGSAGYALPEPEPAAGGGEAAAAKVEPIATRLASASADKGKAGSKACAACHSFDKDGPNKIGPALWEVVERPKASHAGFDYSAALKEKGGAWTYADLDHFLENPKGYAKGTKMAFQGINDAKQRADVVLYLHSLSDSPKPLPAAEKGEEKAEAPKADAPKPEPANAESDKPESAKPESSKSESSKSESSESEPAAVAPEGAKPADAETKAEPAKPAADETADTDRPGGSGKAKSQIESGENPPEATPAGGSADSTPKSSEETPPRTQAPAKPDPAAEKKAEEVKQGGSDPAQ